MFYIIDIYKSDKRTPPDLRRFSFINRISSWSVLDERDRQNNDGPSSAAIAEHSYSRCLCHHRHYIRRSVIWLTATMTNKNISTAANDKIRIRFAFFYFIFLFLFFWKVNYLIFLYAPICHRQHRKQQDAYYYYGFLCIFTYNSIVLSHRGLIFNYYGKRQCRNCRSVCLGGWMSIDTYESMTTVRWDVKLHSNN